MNVLLGRVQTRPQCVGASRNINTAFEENEYTWRTSALMLLRKVWHEDLQNESHSRPEETIYIDS